MTDSSSSVATRAGFVAIIGAPNAGKSTLINQLVGEKIAIVTPKAQTTRSLVRGVLTKDGAQFIFVDTPGVMRKSAKRLLERSMLDASWRSLEEADAAVLLVDALKGFDASVENVLNTITALKQNKKKLPPIFLVFNKVDKIHKPKLLPMMAQAGALGIFEGVMAISALKAGGVEDLLKVLMPYLPESPYLYDEETLTDVPMRLLAAEITRERAFLCLQEELPYSVAVETTVYDVNEEDGSVTIHQDVLVEREAQKKIVIGDNADMVKKIGSQARTQLEALLGTRVHLFLKAKVKPDWAESASFMRMVGLEPPTKK